MIPLCVWMPAMVITEVSRFYIVFESKKALLFEFHFNEIYDAIFICVLHSKPRLRPSGRMLALYAVGRGSTPGRIVPKTCKMLHAITLFSI